MSEAAGDSADGLITIPGRWEFEYEYFAGETASRFFRELRERREIVGRRCPSCERTLVPARSFCDACFVETTDWVDVGPGGRLDMFTILTADFPGLPDPPLAIGYVTLDGADTAILNFVTGIDLSDVDAAAAELMRQPAVEVIFGDDPQGRITDFHFALVGQRCHQRTR
jgi:uncharacterized OB-fold protein